MEPVKRARRWVLIAATLAACRHPPGAAEPQPPGAPAAGQSAAASEAGAREGSSHPPHQGMHHDFSDVARHAERFDDPSRDEWQRPERVLALLALRAGDVVADVGTGTGYFVPHLSRAVGPQGVVWALDVEPAMVEHVERRAREAGLDNVRARTVAAQDPGLDQESVDCFLIVNTWHHLDDRGQYADRLRRQLEPGGSVWVVDYAADSPHGPPPRFRLPAEQVRDELAEGGLQAAIVEDEDLPLQYVVRATRPR